MLIRSIRLYPWLIYSSSKLQHESQPRRFFTIHKRSKHVLSLAAVLLLGLLLAGTAAADHTPNPTSVTIAGNLQSEITSNACGDWLETCAQTHLDDPEDGVWQGTFNVPAGNYLYKAVINDNWSENYPASDKPLAAPGGNVKFYYDHETHWITDNVNSRIVVAAGNFQSFLGCNPAENEGNWQPWCLRSWLQDVDGDGTYTFVTDDIPAGNYEGKAALNEGWDESYPGGNYLFNVPNDCSTTTFTFVSSSNTFSVASVAGNCDGGHDLDNNVEYDGLGHNSHDTLYRVPFGAVTPGTEVILRLRTYHNDVASVRARVWDDAAQGQFFLDLTPVATDVSCYDDAQPDETCDFWQASLTPDAPTTFYYRFIITDGTATAHYEDDAFRDGGWGEARATALDYGYVIQVYDPAFETIEWLQDAVMYQIFPDRFRNGRSNNDPTTNEPRYGWPSEALDRIITKAWSDLPEGYCRHYVNPAQPCTESPRGRDYFGGDIVGVQQRLNYLKDLGVTAIYFNPVFDAASNHAYDTQDYYKIDPFFGTNKEFEKFLKAAEKSGMKVILDGVFNHVSSDSKYFDRYGHFADLGACESVDSPYRDWFNFFEQAGGPCAGPGGPNTMNYPAWFGFDSLPVLNKNNPEVRALFYGDEDSVGRYWLDLGADGWRLDVMGDGSFPAEFWQEFRVAIKDEDPNAPIIGELWKKFEILPKVRGDQADTAMGYRFRNAILGFFGRVDDKGFNDDNQTNQPPSLFATKLISIREDNPDASYYTMMNILGSHDTQRILWLLTPGARNREEREFNAANLARGKQMLRLAAVVQMTTPGTPTIYYGDEIALTGDDDPDDRRTFPWTGGGKYGNGGDAAMLAHYDKLVQWRKNFTVFREGELSFLLTDDANRTMAYMMRLPNQAAIVAVNRAETPQTLTIDAHGLLPDAARLADLMRTVPGTVTAANGVITIQLPALSAAILMPINGQDVVAPNAPTGLTATAGNGQVTLDWNPAGGAARYRLYRSPVTGGGYEFVAEVTASDAVDSSVQNGREYFYVVRAVDAAGNEGAASNEASATPSFPIGYTDIQWPPTINHTLSTNGTENVYGRVYVAGVTDAAGDPDIIRAEVGFGPDGSNPAGWTEWWPMTHNAGCGDCTNNYEYSGKMVPEATGNFDYLVRFSTDNGLTWVYGDVDGWYPDPGQSQTNDPGDMTVSAGSDTTPPAAPANLIVTAHSPESIDLEWDAVGDGDLAFYEVLRSDTAGGPYTEIGETTATTFSDTNVVESETYFYVVRAVDTSFNRSGNSNEVETIALRREVAVTFTVDVPAHTPSGETVYIAGSFNGWLSDVTPMTPVDADTFTITLTGLEGAQIAYKYTLGGIDFFDVEKGASCGEIPDRTITLDYGTDGTMERHDTVVNWRNVAPCGN